MTGTDAADIHELLAGTTFPDAQAQQTDALPKGGTAKAIGETAQLLE
jgi:taurine transport system substrate-binding protein